MVTKRLAIHQPNTFPRIKTLAKLFRADEVVLYDDVQFVKREWQNRFQTYDVHRKLNTWVTFPVVSKGRYEQKISNTELIDPQHYLKKATHCLTHTLGSCPYFSEVEDILSRVRGTSYTTVADLGYACLSEVFRSLGVSKNISRKYAPPNSKSARLLETCILNDADQYLIGSGGIKYLDKNLFTFSGVKISQITLSKSYPPICHGNSSCLDAIANIGVVQLQRFLASDAILERHINELY